MDSLADVTIVSAFGRGQWVARELQSKGLRVQFVDSSELLGPWGADDWEGPFGYFETVQMQPSQLARLVDDEEIFRLEKGFCIWLKSGPLEFKSSLTEHLLRSTNISPLVEEYLRMEPSKEQTRAWEELKKKPFKDNWLAQLSHQIYGTIFLPNNESLDWGQPLPLFSPYQVRRASRVGLKKNIQILEDAGVDVYPNSKVVDVSIDNRSMEAMEISGTSSRVLKSKTFLWMLTSDEGSWFSDSVRSKLFSKGVLKPSWFWTRYRFELPTSPEVANLPGHFVMIHDNLLPWTHENLVIGVRSPSEGVFDFWLRLPSHYRFQVKQQVHYRDKIHSILVQRIPGVHPKCVEMPQENQYGESELGPPRFPVYDLLTMDRYRPLQLKNMFYSGPEFWSGHDWGTQFRQQNSVVKDLTTYLTTVIPRESQVDSEIHS